MLFSRSSLVSPMQKIGFKLALNAAFIFSGCSTFELAQAAGLYPGTYDPNDFIAYAAGTVLGLGIDSVLSKKQGKSLQYDK